MKRPTTFLHRLLLNEAVQVNLTVERDYREICNRFEHEGMSFLTITLPSLDDALIHALSSGRITPAMFKGFKPHRRGGKLPAFMSGFFMRVFELDGSLREHPCIDSIRAIRQVSRAFKKVELPCSSTRVKQAFERYVSNDESVLVATKSDPLRGIISSMLWSDLESFASELFCSPGVFGSGASAERAAFNNRHSVSTWPIRSEESFPAAYHALSREDDIDTLNSIDFIPPEKELPVRVVQVPKTLKTPRIISVEPSYMMLMQQSIAKPLMVWLESELFKFNSIRFSDQSHNREMARIGSIDGGLATIDLKDASDLVSNDLVKEVFKSCPTFLSYLQDSRSTSASMPDGSVVKLRKFASQGSANCFPVEAMVFFTIIMTSIVRQSGRRPSRKLLLDIAASVSVYGDDIIVPTKTVSGVMEDLEANGLKVNRDKSFYTGFFRESCGGDYYKGVDVTPVYVRRIDFTGNIRDPRDVEAYVSLSNQLYLKGLWDVSQYLRDLLSSKGRRFPRSSMPVGIVSYASVCFNTGLRYDPELHSYRVKGVRLRVGEKEDAVGDIRAGMLLCFQHAQLREKLASIRDDDTKHNTCIVGGASDRTGALHGGWDYYSLTASSRHRVQRLAANSNNLPHLEGDAMSKDFLTSVDSYVSKMKRTWAPTKVGLKW